MLRIDFPADLFDELRSFLLSGPRGREEAAYVLCGVSRHGARTRLLPREIIRVPDDAASKSGVHVTVQPEFLAAVIKKARLSGSSILLTHSHPFSEERVGFSGIDDAGERGLIPRLQQRVPGVPHGAIVFGRGSIAARIHLPDASLPIPAEVRVLSEPIRDYRPTHNNQPRDAPVRFARQKAYISPTMQSRLSHLLVGIVGVGGNGMHLLQQLLLVGVRNFLLVDRDTIDETTLNRMPEAHEDDIGKSKITVATRLASRYGVTPITTESDVETKEVAEQLLACDVIFGATDNMASRRVLNRIVFQHHIPVIDTGVELAMESEGTVRSGIVRAQVLLPSSPCLECQGFLRPDDQRAANYGQGHGQHATSVVQWNAMAAALALELFLQVFAEAPTRRPPATYPQYRILEGLMKPARIERVTECSLCREVRGLGDAVRLPVYLTAPPPAAAR